MSDLSQGKARQVFPSKKVCGKCNLPLAFFKLPNGRWCPCNPDGSDHWDTCRTVRYAKAKKGVLVRKELPYGGYIEQWEVPGEKPFVVKHSAGAPK
jgi:hypothetical protein